MQRDTRVVVATLVVIGFGLIDAAVGTGPDAGPRGLQIGLTVVLGVAFSQESWRAIPWLLLGGAGALLLAIGIAAVVSDASLARVLLFRENTIAYALARTVGYALLTSGIFFTPIRIWTNGGSRTA